MTFGSVDPVSGHNGLQIRVSSGSHPRRSEEFDDTPSPQPSHLIRAQPLRTRGAYFREDILKQKILGPDRSGEGSTLRNSSRKRSWSVEAAPAG